MSGKIVVKAAQHIFDKGEKVVSLATVLPMITPYEESQKFRVVDESNKPLENIDYLIIDEHSQAHIGRTNEDGLTKRIFYSQKVKLKIYYGAEAIEKIEDLGLKNS